MKETSLVGTWQSKDPKQPGTLVLNSDGTGKFDTGAMKYEVVDNKLEVWLLLNFTFSVSANTLTLSGGNPPQLWTFELQGTATGGAGDGSNPEELVGKWCYMSNVNAYDGGRMSDRYFTLYPNGTYEYYGETSSSGQYGSMASQESDGGTWSATATSITTNSRKHGMSTYALEKRNHPKTGDPMLVLDGDAYVTYNQRRPW